MNIAAKKNMELLINHHRPQFEKEVDAQLILPSFIRGKQKKLRRNKTESRME